MIFLNEFIEVLFYLGVTIIIELLVLFGLGYFNKKFITLLILINLITNPIYSSLLAIYSHLFNNEMGIILVLLLEVIIVLTEFYVLYKYLKIKYSKIEILITVILVNGFSFLLAEFIRYTFSYYDVFPLF
jgi:hypothetical protein